MEFPRYWAKGGVDGLPVRNPQTGERQPFECWGWSDLSLDEARQVGSERAERVLTRVRGGDPPDRYSYGTPFREDVLDTWRDDGLGAEPWAIVSRNGYGCRILNTATVFFADIDAPELPDSMWTTMRRMVAMNKPPVDTRWQDQQLQKLADVAAAEPSIGMRVYRTYAGLRCLFTHQHARPDGDATLQMLQVLGSDPLYIRLCRSRRCFRARLSPKPWRFGLRALDVDYPWTNPDDRRRAEAWIERYERSCRHFSTCELVAVHGPDATDPKIARVVAFHDRETGVGEDWPLA